MPIGQTASGRAVDYLEQFCRQGAVGRGEVALLNVCMQEHERSGVCAGGTDSQRCADCRERQSMQLPKLILESVIRKLRKQDSS